MSTISLAPFFKETRKPLQIESVNRFAYSDGIIRSEIQASMKSKVYKVTVGNARE